MTLFVHRSQRVEDLARALGEVVRASMPSDPFVSLPIVVGSRGMERWLRVALANQLGAVMGLAFPFPKPAFDGATRFLLEGAPWAEVGGRSPAREADPWEGTALTFRVVSALRALADDQDLEAVRRYLAPGAWLGPVSARELAFGTDLADVINRLMHHRSEDAVGWEESPETAPDQHRWIAKVLAQLASGGRGLSPARLHLALRDANRSTLPKGAQNVPLDVPTFGTSNMPRQTLCIFGLSTLGVGERERVELLARGIDLHLFVLAPSSAWWADFRSKASLRKRAGTARAPDAEAELVAELARQNALLTGLGEPSRQIQAWLESIDYMDREVVSTAVPARSCLGRLQAWIDEAGEMPSPGEAPLRDPDLPSSSDDSLGFHAAHGALRQCEVLRDELLRAFEADPTLEPSEVLVMTPDVETYAPLVAAVFSRRGADGARVPAIPVSIADLGLRRTNPVAEVLLHALTLARERVTASALLGFMGLSPVRARFAIGDEDLADLRELVVRSGLRWAWDAEDRARHDQPPLAQNTVRFALERLAMGVLMPEPGPLEVVRGVVPQPVHTRDRVARFGKLAAICRALELSRATLSEPATTSEWRARLEAVLERFAPVGPGRVAVAERLLTSLPDDPAGLALEREAVVRLLEAEFEDRARGDRPVTGAVTVCALEPMRSVPFRVIALLGMDDGVFPRTPRVRSWDPFAERRPGELDRRAVDRHLLLEALLSARERLLVLWTGFEPKRGQAQPASVVVEELLDTVARLTGRTRDALVTAHPLQPWSARSFIGERRSYDATMARAASALISPREPAALWGEEPELEGGPSHEDDQVGAEALARALAEPQRHLLKERLGVELDPRELEVLDREPIELDSLDNWKVRAPVLRQLVASEEAVDLEAVEARSVERLAGEGLLPLAHAGRQVVRDTVSEAEELRTLWLSATGTREAGRLASVEVEARGKRCTVTGRAPRWLRIGEEVWLEWTLGSRLSSKHKLIAWVELLVARLAHPEVVGARLVAWRAESKKEEGPVESLRLMAPEAERCREHLEALVAQWHDARRRRVALFPKLSPKLGKGQWRSDEVAQKGQSVWEDDQEDVWVTALWGELALEDLLAEHRDELEERAARVWQPVFAAEAKDARNPGSEGADEPGADDAAAPKKGSAKKGTDRPAKKGSAKKGAS